MTSTPAARELLARLLADGAEIEVRNSAGHRPGGDTQPSRFFTALARHHRIEANTVYLRPLVDGGHLDDGRPYFNLNAASVQDLAFLHADCIAEDTAVGFQLADGYAVIRPVTATHAAILDRWDTFYADVLDDDERLRVDAVEPGEWYGRWE